MRYNQPQYGRAAIDRGNPITRGLVAAFLPESNGLLKDHVTGNAFDTSSGVFTAKANKAGRGVTNSARNTQSAPDPGAKYANPSYTYVMLVDMADTGGTYAGLYCRSTSGASAASLQNSPAGAGKFDVYHSGSPAYTTTAGTGFVSYLLSGGLCVLAVCYNDSDRSIRFYLNGALIESGTCSASPTLGDGRLVLFGERGETSTYGMQGTCSGMFLWSRALSDLEAKAITANYTYAPWQIFAPAQKWLLASSGGTNTAVNPTVGTLALSGYAPSIAQTANQSLIPGAGSFALNGYAPSVAQTSGNLINPGTGSITFSGYAPTITQPQNVAPGAGSLAITGYAPSITQGVTTAIAPGVGTLAITGYAPTVAQSANILVYPPAGSLVLTGYAPALAQTANQVITPAQGSIAITGYAPTVAQAAASPSLTPDRGLLQIVGYAPSVTQSAPVTKIGGDDVPRHDEEERIEIWEPRKPQLKRDDSLDKVVRDAYARATGKPIAAAIAKPGPSVRAPDPEAFDYEEDDFEVLLLSY